MDAGFLAEEPNYVGSQSRHARLLDEFLDTAWPRIEQLATKFGQFQPIGGGRLSESAIASYLRQFESEDCARVALRMLENVKIKDRDFFAKSIEGAIRSALHHGDISHVCPFGATGDSSATLSYYMNDLPEELRRPVMPFELALEQEDDRGILLWDDFCGAAGHSITALAQWLGEKKKLARYLLDEELADELNIHRKRAVRKRPLRIAFAMARADGLKRLQAALNVVSLSNATILEPFEAVHDDGGLFGPKVDAFLTARERSSFERYCKRRARDVLHEKVQKSGWTNKKLGLPDFGWLSDEAA